MNFATSLDGAKAKNFTPPACARWNFEIACNKFALCGRAARHVTPQRGPPNASWEVAMRKLLALALLALALTGGVAVVSTLTGEPALAACGAKC